MVFVCMIPGRGTNGCDPRCKSFIVATLELAYCVIAQVRAIDVRFGLSM